MATKQDSTQRNLKVVGDKPTQGEVAAPATVDEPGPKLPELQSALTEFASMQRPALMRADLVRERAAQDVRDLEREIDDLNANEALLERAYDAAKQAIKAQREDLEGALSILQHGLVGSSVESVGPPRPDYPPSHTPVG